MSALRKVDDEEEDKEQAEILEDIFDNTYDSLIQACKKGKVKDDNAVIGAIFSLMERVLPKILDAYKNDPDEYDSRIRATSTALRVTINSFIPIKRFMDIMNSPEMERLDEKIEEMMTLGSTEIDEEELINIFKGIKPVKTVDPDIYG